MTTPDMASGNHPDPRVIPGGGIGDGPIDGVVNLYVIDDDTRAPVSGAEVTVGAVSGTTDATGLFVANDVVGPQTIIVKPAARYRQEVWVGANGANVTINVELANKGAPPSATLQGTVPNLVTAPLPANHARVAVVSYAQTDDLGDAENNFAQTNNQNICVAIQPTDPCAFTVTARTGKLGLIATILDLDTKGTANQADDTFTVVGFAVRDGITVGAGQTLSGQTLTVVPDAMVGDVTVDFATPPAAQSQHAALVAIELGDAGVLPVAFVQPGQPPVVKAPKPAVLSSSAGYRLVALATDGATADAKQTVVLRRGLPGPTLAAGAWLPPPTNVTVSRTTATWTATAGATLHSVAFSQGDTEIVSISVLDGSTTATLPATVTLPSGSLDAAVSALAADGLDVTNFALDTDRTKLTGFASQAKSVQ